VRPVSQNYGERSKEAFERNWTQRKVAKEENEDGSRRKLEIMNDTAAGGNLFETAVMTAKLI
jgi:hypothetical protein